MNSTLNIATAQSGFYKGFNTIVAITPKIVMLGMVIWASALPGQASATLLSIQKWSVGAFSAWYMYAAATFMLGTLSLALIPKTGAIKLGKASDTPEFSNFSWFSMMFGAGLGIGMLTYSTAEPIYHFAANPDTILGTTQSLSENNVRAAYKWGIFHYAFTPWACYVVIGLSLAYFSYAKDLPLTIRSGLKPLFGNMVSGVFGHAVDIVAILATIIGVGVTVGYGVSQFASGLFNITGAAWMVDSSGVPSYAAQIMALTIVLLASTWSAMSGVKRGIKWLSNINMSLSFFLLAFFAVFGALGFAAKHYVFALWDYLINILPMSFTVWDNEVQPKLAQWQNDWSVFYWAWWIAFAPFVGLFLARVSKGRTVREFVVGAMIVPSLTCLAWFTLVGGTAIDLELNGSANGQILNADISAQLFQTLNLLLSPGFAAAMSGVVVVLLLTYLITTVDSAILIVTTLASAGDQSRKNTKHIIIWGMIFTLVVASLLAAGGMDALRSLMIVGALPFSFVIMLMLISLIKSLLKHPQETL